MNELTGRHVLLIIGGGFAVIVAVNIALAVAAVRTFPGLEVRNSYVASQVFDDEREAHEALGWNVTLSHGDGHLTLAFDDAEGAVGREIVSAVIGRTTHVADDIRPDFAWAGDPTPRTSHWPPASGRFASSPAPTTARSTAAASKSE